MIFGFAAKGSKVEGFEQKKNLPRWKNSKSQEEE
jgi:hypothetical protein